MWKTEKIETLFLLRETFWSLLPAGIYAVEVTAQGYKPLYISLTIISGKINY